MKSIQQVGLWNESRWVWNLGLRRILLEWEKRTTHTVGTSNIQQDSQDRIVWAAEEGGVFSVKSAYRALQMFTLSDSSQAMEILWDIKVVPNALMLAWRVLEGKVPTRTNLHRRGVSLLYRLDLGHRCQRKTSDISHQWSNRNCGPRKLGPTNSMS